VSQVDSAGGREAATVDGAGPVRPCQGVADRGVVPDGDMLSDLQHQGRPTHGPALERLLQEFPFRADVSPGAPRQLIETAVPVR